MNNYFVNVRDKHILKKNRIYSFIITFLFSFIIISSLLPVLFQMNRDAYIYLLALLCFDFSFFWALVTLMNYLDYFNVNSVFTMSASYLLVGYFHIYPYWNNIVFMMKFADILILTTLIANLLLLKWGGIKNVSSYK